LVTIKLVNLVNLRLDASFVCSRVCACFRFQSVIFAKEKSFDTSDAQIKA